MATTTTGGVRITGTRKLGVAIQTVDRGLGNLESIGLIAQDVARAAVSAAPRDTGELAGSIQAQRRGPGDWQVFYSKWQGVFPEWGTKYQTAQPFMAPAAAGKVAELERRTQDEVQDDINRAVRKADGTGP